MNDLMADIRKLNARPGGGAIVITVANFAVNLSLMMKKKDFGVLQEEADVSYETMIEISDILLNLYDEDIKYTNILLDEYRNKGFAEEKTLIDAARPQIRLNTLALKAMDILGFYLEHGRSTTLSDGEIANNLLKAAIESSIPTIKINLKDTNYKYNIKEVLDKKDYYYKRNLSIIERRKV